MVPLYSATVLYDEVLILRKLSYVDWGLGHGI